MLHLGVTFWSFLFSKNMTAPEKVGKFCVQQDRDKLWSKTKPN